MNSGPKKQGTNGRWRVAHPFEESGKNRDKYGPDGTLTVLNVREVTARCNFNHCVQNEESTV